MAKINVTGTDINSAIFLLMNFMCKSLIKGLEDIWEVEPIMSQLSQL
jgi:hypothetical protein